MSSTVRIDETDKERLRRLQEEWARLRGERPTQEELLGRALAYIEENKESFLDEIGWEPLSEEEEIEAICQRSRAMGGWSAKDADEIIYE